MIYSSSFVALALPTSVSAESYWFIHNYRQAQRRSMEKVEMESAAACEKEARRWENSSTHGDEDNSRRFHCVIGK